jgi:protein-arginine deiminase
MFEPKSPLRFHGSIALGLGLILAQGCSSSEETMDLMKPSAPVSDAGGHDAEDKDEGTQDVQGIDGQDGQGDSDEPVTRRVLGDLVVDANRNGVIEPDSFEEQTFEDQWNESIGAILLANVDDDDGDGVGDHLDEVVNGPEDAKDLARIHVVGFEDVPANAQGIISVDPEAAPWVRLFRVQADEFVLEDPTHVVVTADDLAHGVEFAIEAKFFPTSTAAGAWSGFVDIEHIVTNGHEELSRDQVRMRVAPLVFMHNLMKTEKIWVGGFDGEFIKGLKAAATAAAVAVDVLNYDAPGYANHDFDQWTQDHFEMGYASMPSKEGMHTMLVAFRTPRVKRTSADVVFVEFLGKDFGAIHVHDQPYDQATRSLDSTGNWDTVPPHRAHGVSYPQGRFILGSTAERHPDPVAEEFVQAQRVQPLIRVDTSWLAVGHVDEILSFVPANSERGWRMLFARPKMAVDMLMSLQKAGHGSAKMHEGKWWWGGPASRTVDQVLGNANLMATNQEDQAILDGILLQLKDELDLQDDEIIDMPFLEQSIPEGSVAYQPGTVNLLHFDGHVLIADPFGPNVGGVDVFKQDLDTRLSATGLVTHYVDDWNTYHRNNGEVHCATNVLRVVPHQHPWWESGR